MPVEQDDFGVRNRARVAEVAQLGLRQPRRPWRVLRVDLTTSRPTLIPSIHNGDPSIIGSLSSCRQTKTQQTSANPGLGPRVSDARLAGCNRRRLRQLGMGVRLPHGCPSTPLHPYRSLIQPRPGSFCSWATTNAHPPDAMPCPGIIVTNGGVCHWTLVHGKETGVGVISSVVFNLL